MCNCNEGWSTYNDILKFDKDDKNNFTFLIQCDKCGEIMEAHCIIKEIKEIDN